MYRLIAVIISYICVLTSLGQSFNFQFNSDGNFIDSLTQQNFVVVEIPNQTAEEIYNKLLVKVHSMSNEISSYGLSNDIQGINNKSISYSTTLLGVHYDHIALSLAASFTFDIKDGRIKINAPVVHRVITGNPNPNSSSVSIGGYTVPTHNSCSFKTMVDDIFKKGQVKKKRVKYYTAFNKAVNENLYEMISTLSKFDEDDW